MVQIDLKNALLEILDGTTPTPLKIAVKLGEGTFSYTTHKDRQYYRNRGLLDTVRNGDEQPVDVSFDSTWEFITGDGTATIEDALENVGDADEWVTTDTDDPCAPFAVDVRLTYTPPCSSVKAEILTFADFRHETLTHDAKAGTIQVAGKANITVPDVSRVTQS